MKIVIIGDVGASQSNIDDFCSGNKSLFSEEIQAKCKDADIVILNLEKPLTDVSTPLGKCPPDFIAPTKTINGIKLLNPTVAVLANNHIMDQKEQGLFSTMEILRQNGIRYVGAGRNAAKAKQALIVESDHSKIGIYACCEKEFSGATDSTPGANLFDPLETPDEILKLRKSCDYLVVLYHGGMQGYPYPTPYQQKVCRKMCDKGADFVVCQHSHIVGCHEQYNGSCIVYGQGNFLLDDADIDSWKTGLLIETEFFLNNVRHQYIPVQTSEHTVVLHNNPVRVLKDFDTRSEEIRHIEFVENNFSGLCTQKLHDYLLVLSGKKRIVRRVLRRLGMTKPIFAYDKSTCNMILDYFNCEAHREAIVRGLENIK